MPKIQKKTKSSNVLKFSFTETLSCLEPWVPKPHAWFPVLFSEPMTRDYAETFRLVHPRARKYSGTQGGCFPISHK